MRLKSMGSLNYGTPCKHDLVLLRIPNPQPNPRILPESVRVRIREFFAAVSDGFGLSVRESIFTYQVAPFKRRCVTVCGRQCERVGE